MCRERGGKERRGRDREGRKVRTPLPSIPAYDPARDIIFINRISFYNRLFRLGDSIEPLIDKLSSEVIALNATDRMFNSHKNQFHFFRTLMTFAYTAHPATEMLFIFNVDSL